eukprot:3412694-Heterocapsa_arctica.AAC.1
MAKHVPPPSGHWSPPAARTRLANLRWHPRSRPTQTAAVYEAPLSGRLFLLPGLGREVEPIATRPREGCGACVLCCRRNHGQH